MKSFPFAHILAIAMLPLLGVRAASAGLVDSGTSGSGTMSMSGTWYGGVASSTGRIQFSTSPNSSPQSIEMMPETMHKVVAMVLGAGILLFVFLGLLAILASIFWIWMLVDCSMNPGLTDTQKIIWVLIVLFTHLIGAIIYYFVARPRRGVTS